MRLQLRELALLRVQYPKEMSLETEFNKIAMMSQDLNQNLHTTMLDTIVDAYEQPEIHPVELWIEN